MFKPILTLITADIKALVRQPFSWLSPLLFFLIVITLFPIATGSEFHLINQLAPGIIWVAALLAILLSMNQLFSLEKEEGLLDLLCLSPYPLPFLVLCKMVSFWLVHCLPLIVISPLLGFLLNLTLNQDYALMISLLLGTPILTLIGAIGAALTISLRGSQLLLPILIMPLYVPVLIFGTGTLLAANTDQALAGFFAMLGALMLFSLLVSPLMTSLALRIGAQA